MSRSHSKYHLNKYKYARMYYTILFTTKKTNQTKKYKKPTNKTITYFKIPLQTTSFYINQDSTPKTDITFTVTNI